MPPPAPPHPPHRAALGFERPVFFIDAVFAIAITLLALAVPLFDWIGHVVERSLNRVRPAA